MIKVTETIYMPHAEPIVTTKEYRQFTKNDFVRILQEQHPVNNHAIYQLKKVNECVFTIGGIKRKIVIKEDEEA